MICYTWIGMKTTTTATTQPTIWYIFTLARSLALPVCVYSLCIGVLIFWNQYPPTATSNPLCTKRAISGWKKCGKQNRMNFIDKLTLRAFAHKNFIAWTWVLWCAVCCVGCGCGYTAEWQWHLTVHFRISISLSMSSFVGYIWVFRDWANCLSVSVCLSLSLSPSFALFVCVRACVCVCLFSFVYWGIFLFLTDVPLTLHWLKKNDILFD